MDDLNSSPLFDDRHMKFLRGILTGRPLSPISATEQKFLARTPLVKQVNEELDRMLLQKMESWKKFISVQEAVAFLIKALRRKQLDDAVFILDTAVQETRSAKFKDLLTILDEAKNMPASWALSVYAEEIDNRHQPAKTENLSGLNLEAMKNFR